MTHEQMLQQRLRALLQTINTHTMSDALIAEYERLHREITRTQDERTFK